MVQDVPSNRELRTRIKEGLTSPSKTYHEKRRTADLEQLLEASTAEPETNATMRVSGIDLPARLLGDAPLSDVEAIRGHAPPLIRELRFRHTPACLPLGREGKRVHPVPDLEKDKQIVGFDGSFEKMGIAQLKNLLMVDQERLFQMKDEGERENCGSITFPSIRGETITVPLQRKPIATFNTASFKILCPDACFD